MDPISNAIQTAGNMFNSLKSQFSSGVQNVENFAQGVGNDVTQGLANAQQWVQSSQPTEIPQIQPFSNNDFWGQAGNAVSNIPIGMVNTLVGKGVIDPSLDIGRMAAADFTGSQLPAYQSLKSSQARLGYNLSGIGNTPQQMIGNIAGSAEAPLMAYGGGKVFGLGSEAAAKAGQGFLPTLLSGAKTGAALGGTYGLAQGLEQGRNQTLPQQLLQGGEQGLAGAAGGGILGGLMSGGGYAFGQAKNAVVNALQRRNPDADPQFIQTQANQFIRDEAGRFAKGQQPAADEPRYYGDLRKSLGLPSNPQRGGIDFGAQAGIPPQEGSLEQMIEQKEGFQPGMRRQFDMALQNGDAQTVKKLLPDIPDSYKATFQDKINSLIGEPRVANFKPEQTGQQTDIGEQALSPERLNQAVPDLTSPEGKQQVQDMVDKAQGVQGELDSRFKQLDQQVTAKNPEPLPWEGAKQNLGNTDIGAQLTNEPPKTYGSPPPGEGQGTPGVPALDPKQVGTQARLARSGTMDAINFRAQTLAQQMDRVLKTPEDNLNIRLAMESPEKLDQYAQQSSNPAAFKDIAQKYSNFTDYVANQLKQTGGSMNFINDYFTHIWDLSTPEARQIYQDIMTANAKNFQSGFTKERLVNTLQEGLSKGLQLQNTNASSDVVRYANSMGTQIGAQAFNQKINELRPGGAIQGNVGTAYSQGKQFLQSNVPGNKGTLIDPEIQAQMEFYNRSAFADNPVISGKDVQIGDKTLHIPGADEINQLMKQTKLGFGGFHGLNTTLRQAVNNPLAIKGAVENTFSMDARNAFNQKLIDDGVIDFGTSHGITFDASADVLPKDKTLMDTVKGANPLTRFTNAMFGGLINTYKGSLARSMMEQFPNTATDPLQEKQAQAMGSQINNLMGGINYEALGRNKSVQQGLRLVGLAPDFNEGIIRQVLTAVNPGNYVNTATRPAALFAARQVVGQTILYAGIAELSRRLITGAFSPDFKSFVMNSVVKAQFPLPNTPAFNNPRTDRTQAATLPSSETSVMGSALSDPSHFLQARGSALLSLGAQMQSGKDYYGNSLVNPWNGTPDTFVNRLKAAGINQLPIPVQQVMKTMQGRQTPAVSALNIAGLRVGNNPNDPKVQEAQQYYNAVNQAAAGLNPNDQKTFMGTLHPQTKDPETGNPVVDKNILTTPDKYETLLTNPKIFNAEQTLQKGQASHDPLWNYPQPQIQAYMKAQVLAKNSPTGRDPMASALLMTVPQQMFDDRQKYFKGLVDQGVIPQGTKPTQPERNIYTTPNLYETILANPQLIPQIQAAQKQSAQHDPLWDLNPNQIHAALQYEVISKNDPGGDKATTKALTSALPATFFQDRQAYFSSLATQGLMPPQTGPQKPQMTPEVSKFWQDYSNMPYGTGARSQALNTPLGQMALQQLNAQQQFTNSERIDMGLPPIAQQQTGAGGGLSNRTASVIRSRLPIRAATSGGMKKVAPATSLKGLGSAQRAGTKGMIANTVKNISMAKLKAPKVHFGGGTKGAVKGLSLKVARVKQPQVQQFKIPVLQRENLRQLGKGFHSRKYGAYTYQ